MGRLNGGFFSPIENESIKRLSGNHYAEEEEYTGGEAFLLQKDWTDITVSQQPHSPHMSCRRILLQSY